MSNDDNISTYPVVGQGDAALVGYENGRLERKRLNLTYLETQPGKIYVAVGPPTYALSSSFVRGLFDESLNTFTSAMEFFDKYQIVGPPEYSNRVEETIKYLFFEKVMAKPLKPTNNRELNHTLILMCFCAAFCLTIGIAIGVTL